MDMSSAFVNIRMIQSVEDISYNKIIEEFKNKSDRSEELINKLDENFGKVELSFDVGLAVEDIRAKVVEYNDTHAEKLKVLAIDYLECIAGPYADATANTGIIAQKLKDIANEFDLCVWLLLQTQKSSGDPADELMSMRNIKGASSIEQACAIVITLSRPGFNPKNDLEDKFIQVSVVKNRMGKVGSRDYHWNGKTGHIRELTYIEGDELEELRKRKEEARKAALPGGFGD
jgi:replicative DNA helicase